eukprot:gene17581-19333_t
MGPTNGKRASKCGRGVLKLTSFQPCPRPGTTFNGQAKKNEVLSTQAIQPRSSMQESRVASQENTGISKDVRLKNKQENGMLMNNKRTPNNFLSSGPTIDTGRLKDLPKVLAKYSYTANPDKPGGFEEMSMKQGDKLYFHSKHQNNPHWVLAEHLDGSSGYVPASYLMNKRLEIEEEEKQRTNNHGNGGGGGGFGTPAPGSVKQPIKSYVSAYVTKDTAQVQPINQYMCDVCDKSFNGPQPYKMHMSSKAHKEEVEYQNQR